MDFLCLMDQSHRRGYLEFPDGSAMSIRHLSKATGVSVKQLTRLVTELETSGVFSRTQKGIIYSRRMVRDTAIREQNRRYKAKSRSMSGRCQTDVRSMSDRSSSSSSSSTSVNNYSLSAREAEPSVVDQTAGELARRENQRERGPPDESYTSLDASPAVKDAFSRMLNRRWEMISADSRWKILRKIERHGEPAMLAAAEECIRDGETALTTCFTVAARTAIRAGTKKGGSLEQREDSPARVRDGDDDKYAHLDPPAADNGGG